MDGPTGNTTMDNYIVLPHSKVARSQWGNTSKDSAGIVIAKKDPTADEPEHVKAPWRPWEGPAHAVQSGASPVQ